MMTQKEIHDVMFMSKMQEMAAENVALWFSESFPYYAKIPITLNGGFSDWNTRDRWVSISWHGMDFKCIREHDGWMLVYGAVEEFIEDYTGDIEKSLARVVGKEHRRSQ